PKGTIAEVGAVGVKIGAEIPVNGVPHKPTPAQYQYLLFPQMSLDWFVERQFDDSGRDLVDPDLDVDGMAHLGIFRGDITQADPLVQGRGHGPGSHLA